MKNHQLFIYFICLVSAMGGLLFGYDWVVIGCPSIQHLHHSQVHLHTIS